MRTQEKFLGAQVYTRPSRGLGAEPSPDSGEFSKYFKIFFINLQIFYYFYPIFQKIYKLSVKFSRVWTINAIGWEIVEKSLNFFEQNSIKIEFLDKLLLKV